MARTERNLPHWAKNQAARVRASEDEYEPRSKRRLVRFAAKVEQNRDGAVGSDVHMPQTGNPKNYDTWSTVANKAWGKAASHRLDRRTVKIEIDEQEDDE